LQLQALEVVGLLEAARKRKQEPGVFFRCFICAFGMDLIVPQFICFASNITMFTLQVGFLAKASSGTFEAWILQI
jgi:hypothetical protein